MNRVEVIIPTMARSSRRSSLFAAIHSVLTQDGAIASVIVVVNGDRFEADIVERLKNMAGVTLAQRMEAGQIGALSLGVRLATADYVGFLDDDDEYLPGTLAERIRCLSQEPAAALAVCPGYLEVNGKRQMICQVKEACDPFHSLSYGNWLASCGAVFRRNSVTSELIESCTSYFEWTYLAYHFSITGHVSFCEKPGFVVHSTPGSLSKSESYALSAPYVFERLIEEVRDSKKRKVLSYRASSAWHDVAELHLKSKNLTSWWKAHIKSLLHRGGSRYILYTRRGLLM